MMYVVRDKNTKLIIHEHDPKSRKKLSDKEIFEHFDPKSMEIGILPRSMKKVPSHFKIEGRRAIVKLTKRQAERHERELHSSDTSSAEKPERVKPVRTKSLRPKSGAVVKMKAADPHAQIELEIAKKFSPGNELRTLKDYVAWIDDGEPKRDVREREYLKMEKYVNKVRQKHKEAPADFRDIVNKRPPGR